MEAGASKLEQKQMQERMQSEFDLKLAVVQGLNQLYTMCVSAALVKNYGGKLPPPSAPILSPLKGRGDAQIEQSHYSKVRPGSRERVGAGGRPGSGGSSAGMRGTGAGGARPASGGRPGS